MVARCKKAKKRFPKFSEEKKLVIQKNRTKKIFYDDNALQTKELCILVSDLIEN